MYSDTKKKSPQDLVASPMTGIRTDCMAARHTNDVTY